MKPAKFQDFVKYANFFYNTIGVEPYDEGKKLKHKEKPKLKIFMSNLIFLVGIINMNLMLLSEIIFVVMALVNGNNFVEATMTMSYIGFVLVGNCKMLFVWLQKSALTKFVNGLKRIFPQDKDLQQSYNLQKYLKQCSRITLSFSMLYMILIWTYNLFSIVQYIIYDKWLGMKEVEQTLPYFMYIPWNWHDNWSYYVVYAAQDLAGYTSAAGQIASDLFLVACTTQLIMHFDYICQRITEYQSSCNHKDFGKKDMIFLNDIIRYHAYLLK